MTHECVPAMNLWLTLRLRTSNASHRHGNVYSVILLRPFWDIAKYSVTPSQFKCLIFYDKLKHIIRFDNTSSLPRAMKEFEDLKSQNLNNEIFNVVNASHYNRSFFLLIFADL